MCKTFFLKPVLENEFGVKASFGTKPSRQNRLRKPTWGKFVLEITSLEKKGLSENDYEETCLVRKSVGSIVLKKNEFVKKRLVGVCRAYGLLKFSLIFQLY